jgi:hypothetical protein
MGLRSEQVTLQLVMLQTYPWPPADQNTHSSP